MEKNDIASALIEDTAVTAARIIEEMNTHSWVHFDCHGIQDQEPLKSRLHLYDSRLVSFGSCSKRHLMPVGKMEGVYWKRLLGNSNQIQPSLQTLTRRGYKIEAHRMLLNEKKN